MNLVTITFGQGVNEHHFP